MGGVRAVDGLGQDKDDFVAQAIERLGQAIARDAQAAGDEGGELPAEHQDAHVAVLSGGGVDGEEVMGEQVSR